MITAHFDPAALRARVMRDAYGFLSESDINALAQHTESRLWPVLVRCGGGRALVSTQDVKWLTNMVKASGDYVRDVSFPAK